MYCGYHKAIPCVRRLKVWNCNFAVEYGNFVLLERVGLCFIKTVDERRN